MNITSFDRTNLKLISAEMEAALAPVATKYGITFTYKGSRFLPDNATFKFEGATVGVGGVANTKERDNFKAYSELMYGIPASILDTEINYYGKRYIVKGLNTRRSKYPIVAERVSDGKSILLPVDMVKIAINSSKPIQVNSMASLIPAV